MRQEERRLLPDQRQQLVQIVRRRRAVAGADPHRRVDRVDQPELLAVDQLPFLAFLDPLDRQPHLLFELVERAVVQVRDARMHAHHRLHGRQRIFARDWPNSRRTSRESRRSRRSRTPGRCSVRRSDSPSNAIPGVRRSPCWNSSLRLGSSPSTASRSLRDSVNSTQGVIVRTVTSEGLSETRSVSPKNSPSVSRAIRRSLPCTPLLSTSTCPWAMMKNLLRSSPSTISLLPQRNLFRLEAAGHPRDDRLRQLAKTAARCAAPRRGTKTRRRPERRPRSAPPCVNSTFVRLTRYVPPSPAPTAAGSTANAG